MSIACPFYLIDAFVNPHKASGRSGNPAGVCLLDGPADPVWMQAVAFEINQAETAFVYRQDDGAFELRWFTPTVEVDLCGHATIATSLALWTAEWATVDHTIQYETQSGRLSAWMKDGVVWLDFPALSPTTEAVPGFSESVFAGRNSMDWFVEMESEREVLTYQPDMNAIEAMGLRGLILTAKAESGTSYDFVSRFFAPQSGVPEDSVTGSAHSALAPYWTARLGKPELIGLQASERSGILHTVSLGDRVRLGGLAEVVVEGTWKSST